MWLPETLYKRLPHIWLLAGVLFLAACAYMTLAYKWSIWYFGAGVACLVYGGVLFLVRSRKRPGAQTDDRPA
jgi:hypothetical protein